MDTLLINTCVRFNLADALLIHPLCTYAVFPGIIEQSLDHRQVLRRGGDNDFAGVLTVYTMLCRECFHAARTLGTYLGL
ncbi:hypothetical protein GALL_470030 [mine drainage metagenome]|uniref:Uncharacterized protein n=1 Tax=mine drainage metagenome TaxID=410659 RepID=A0A1J5PKP1_9ZZZZ